MTEMAPDIESIELLDFEFAPPCEDTTEECDQTAEWFWIMACCGQIYLICDEHHHNTLRYKDAHSQDPAKCMQCGTTTTMGKFYLSFGRI